jgi:hypothetical protein
MGSEEAAGLEAVAEGNEGAMEVTPGRAGSNPQPAGNFIQGVALLMAAEEDLALHVAQPFERVLDRLGQFRTIHRLRRRRRRAFADPIGHRDDPTPRPEPLRAEIERRAIKPGEELRAGTPSRQHPVGRDEDVLGDVERFVGIAKEPAGDRQDPRVMELHQRVERRSIALLEPRDEIGLAHD